MINVLNPKLDFLAQIDGFESFVLTRRFHEPGEFELHVNQHSFGANELDINNVIALNKNRVGIIKHRELVRAEDGKSSDMWTIQGPTAQGLLRQRITLPPDTTAYDNKSGQGETVMKHYVDRNAINPDDRDRKLTALRRMDDEERGGHISFQSRYKNLAEELKEISEATDLGWDITVDTRRGWYEFDCYEGRDLTKMDGEYPPVAFAVDNDTLKAETVTDSILNMRNAGYVGGGGEGTEREILTIGNKKDYERHETFIDARDVGGESSNGESLQERGDRKMKEVEHEFFYEGEIETPVSEEIFSFIHESFVTPYQSLGEYRLNYRQRSPFIYGEDFDLGDIVMYVNKELGIKREARITEVKEIYEVGRPFKIEITLGKSRPTIIDQIKSRFKEIEKYKVD